MRPVPNLTRPLEQITEDDVPSILLPLPTATSARQAAAALGEAIEEHGSGEGFGILFSDAKLNAWVSVLAGERVQGAVPDCLLACTSSLPCMFARRDPTTPRPVEAVPPALSAAPVLRPLQRGSTWKTRRATTGWRSAFRTTASLCPLTRAVSRCAGGLCCGIRGRAIAGCCAANQGCCWDASCATHICLY